MMYTITNIRKMWKHDFIIESQNFCHTIFCMNTTIYLLKICFWQLAWNTPWQITATKMHSTSQSTTASNHSRFPPVEWRPWTSQNWVSWAPATSRCWKMEGRKMLAAWSAPNLKLQPGCLLWRNLGAWSQSREPSKLAVPPWIGSRSSVVSFCWRQICDAPSQLVSKCRWIKL